MSEAEHHVHRCHGALTHIHVANMQIAIQEGNLVQPAVAAVVVSHPNTIIPHEQRSIAIG